MNDREYTYLKKKLMDLTGINLDNYDSHQMRRRLKGFIGSRSPNLSLYCKMLDRRPADLEELTNFLTINVSEFFRDPTHFSVLRRDVIPRLLRESPRLNVWSAGCSYGAEAYSVLMMLEDLQPGARHRILATDIDHRILSRARQGGPYSAKDLRNVDRRSLLRRFSGSDGQYQVAPQLMRRIEFKRQDLLADEPESGFDLVICRNVMIYFTREAKRRSIAKLVASLKENGVLFIGATETLLHYRQLGLEKVHSAIFRKPAPAVAGIPEARVGGLQRG